jgi:hypothetical protein
MNRNRDVYSLWFCGSMPAFVATSHGMYPPFMANNLFSGRFFSACLDSSVPVIITEMKIYDRVKSKLSLALDLAACFSPGFDPLLEVTL